MQNGKLVEMSPEELDAVKAIEGAVETLKKCGWRDSISSRGDPLYAETLMRKNGKEERTKRFIGISLQWSQPLEESELSSVVI